MSKFFATIVLVAGILLPATSAFAVDAPATSSPAAAESGVGIRLVDAPVAARNDPRARVYIVDHLNPGTMIRRRIEVSNKTSQPAQISLYAGAASISQGSFLGAAGRTANDLSTWTSVQPAGVHLAPGAKQMVTVVVTIPKDAAPGEQYGVVWAEVQSAPSAGGVTQVSRVGIRLYLSVGPGGPPAANFTIDTLTAGREPGGRPTVRAAVHNTGGRAIDLSGTIQLASGPGGLSAGPFPVNLGTTVAIGGTETALATLDKALPPGPWTATIRLHSGLLEVTEEATLTFPVAGLAAPIPAVVVPATTSVPGWVFLVGIAITILLLAVLGLLVVILRRRSAQHRVGVSRS